MAFRRVPGFLAFVGRAPVERRRAARDLGERPVELELQDAREEIARVGRVVGHVVLRARVEPLFAARRTTARRPDTSGVDPTTPCCSRSADTSPENTFQRH